MLNYSLSNICGCVYTGGKIRFSGDGNTLFVPVNNRINVYDLSDNKCNTLKSESKNDLRHIVIHPNMEIAITIDKFEYGCILNLLKDQIISRILFKSKTGIVTSFNYESMYSPQEEQDSVNCALFTHRGEYFLLGIGRRVVIWKSPNRKNNYRLVKYNDICYHSLNVTWIDVSEDDRFFLTCSYDLTIRIHTVEKRRKVRPTVLGGNKSTIVAAFFSKGGEFIFSVNQSGLILVWSYEEAMSEEVGGAAGEAGGEAMNEATGDGTEESPEQPEQPEQPLSTASAPTKAFARRWRQKKVYFCNQEKNEEVTSVCFNREHSLVVIAYSSGRFGIYSAPDMTSLYTISINASTIDDITISNDGQWIALAEANNGTVIVWEWKSESYIMKQSTTSRNVRCVKFSPIISHLKIGSHIVETANAYHESENFTSKFVIVTGSEDGSIRLYDYVSYMNFVTFSVHTDAVTDVCFLPQGNAFVSCSLDGTVRAFDLLRYRNFKVQFLCVSVNLSGNIVAAGGRGSEYVVYIWNVQTAKCIDKLYGHNSPIMKVCFSTSLKNEGIIASCSWSKKVLLWDLYARRNKGSKFDEMVNSHDVSFMCFDPRGNDILAICTMSCKIIFWDVQSQEIIGTVEGARDIKRGHYIGQQYSAIPRMKKRKKIMHGRHDENGKHADSVYEDELEDEGINSVVNQNCYFTAVDYIQNGNYIIGCANCSVSLYIYDTNLYVLMKIIDLTSNYCVDGIRREYSRRYLTAQGSNICEFDLSDEEGDLYIDKYRIANRKKKNSMLPGSLEEHWMVNRFKKHKLTLNRLSISGDDRHVAVACSVGLYVFTKDHQFQYVVPVRLCSKNGDGKHITSGGNGGYRGLVAPLLYEPQYLTEHVNVRNLKMAVRRNEYVKAFLLCLALNSYEHIVEVYEKTPYHVVPLCVKILTKPFVFLLINFIKVLLLNDTMKHIHLHLCYLNAIFTSHFSVFVNTDMGGQSSRGGSTKQGKQQQGKQQEQQQGGGARVVSPHGVEDHRNALLLILKQLFTVYSGLQHLYGDNTHVLRYLCAQRP
ncbi:WD-repeat protein p103 [Plasmodium cynomolgi strain B]|uniref:WD-repeat protein p103 n=1 Tax=Plasmodium cynomolgi (strain B) TaxID=1120755 RepID=K6UPJ5_PLACD|nr:WD-repeat protein p103 [Plasmodium cynomolgi strain B]GAB64514.1 WD-repeat protein p103 [Plasmodium cynomolgi strain B]